MLADTDSFMHKIEVENVYEDFYKNKELFDFSNNPKIQNITIMKIT